MYWYHKAAEQDYTEAQFHLGIMYHLGQGTDIDLDKALHWYQLAAEEGMYEAQFMMGNMYYNDEGIDKDLDKALHWYHLAAEQGYQEAQFMLGNMYYQGEGTSQDRAVAMKWYQLAAKQGHTDAKDILYKRKSQIYSKGNITQTRKLAEHGDASAQYELGTHWFDNEEIYDVEEAIHWFKLAADQGHTLAQVRLGDIYYNGVQALTMDIIEKDREKAYYYHNLAGSPEDDIIDHVEEIAHAKRMVGRMLVEGDITTDDISKARRWYSQAAGLLNIHAMYELGIMYLYGIGGPQDLRSAIDWLTEAAVYGLPEALKLLEELKSSR